MLKIIKTKNKDFNQYKSVIPDKLFFEIKSLAQNLKGVKVFHVNSVSAGGGVAEILRSLVPLMRNLGIDARWYKISTDKKFFTITKNMHNALQGGSYKMPIEDKKKYINHTFKIAKRMENVKPNIWVIHDAQPVAVSLFLQNFKPAISHLHIDLSSNNENICNFLYPFLFNYNKIIFSSSDFVKKELQEKSVVFPPAIDAFSNKNKKISTNKAKKIIESFGLNLKKPLITQVSRFDSWKDPLGVIDAYRIAKQDIPDLQLALVGFLIAKDDPEANNFIREIKKKVGKDPDIFLFYDLKTLGNLDVDLFVNAIQTVSDVILQKSIKEGFGLTVTEAMWKEKAVIGGNVGGIKLQIKHNKNGFLVNNNRAAAKTIVKLIKSKDLAARIGKEAKKSVQANFLMPRLLRDYLKIIIKTV